MELTPKIREQLNSWADIMEPIVNSIHWDNLYRMLKKAVVEDKKTVIPKSADVWKSWSLCDRHKVKAVVIAQDPYPSIVDGKMVASGIPFDCSATGKLQPSLWSWWEAVSVYQDEQKGMLDPDIWHTCDLSWLLTEEHVLLINSCGTTEKDKPGVHWQWWEPIMKMFMEVLNNNYRGLPIVLMGQQAQRLEGAINPLIHHIYKCEHPVMAARNNRAWNTNMFAWVNNIIEKNNGVVEKIQWYRVEGQKKKVIEQAPWE